MSSEIFMWDKTRIMLERLEDEIDNFGGVPFYKGKHIINRDSNVLGGICLGEHARGAIYVDPNSPYLEKLTNLVIEKSTENGRVSKRGILRVVYETVKNTFPQTDMKELQEIFRSYNAINDEEISLDIFIENGVGVCVQHALTSAAILEKLKEKGIVRGTARVNRNKSFKDGTNYGHAWCRYTNSAGQVFILDSALGYLGRIEDSVDSEWNYFRPDE